MSEDLDVDPDDDEFAPEDWVTTVGTFMLTFGRIEEAVNDMLRIVCLQDAYKLIVQRRLSSRVKELERLLVGVNLSVQNRATFAYNLSMILNFAKTRNLIAHNPLTLDFNDVFSDKYDRNPYPPQRIRSLRIEASADLNAGGSVKFAMLQKRLQDVLALNANLYSNVGILRDIAHGSGEFTAWRFGQPPPWSMLNV